MIKVDVKKRLSETVELAISFMADNGVTILAGHSGAGKTSTLRMIAGIVRPDEGFIQNGAQIYFDSAKNIDLPIQKRRTGFIFQDYALFPHLTAAQNIAYGAAPAKRASLVAEMLETFQITHIAARRPREMSGGEQQRVAIARALASEPSIMLLDEPLSAVDVETRLKLLDEIEAAQCRAGIPFIYVTHNLAESERLGAKMIVLENGKVKI